MNIKPVEIEVPDWVPPRVADWAGELASGQLGQDSEIFDLIMRLLCDARMRPVWGQLHKQKRTETYESSGQWLHPANLPERMSSWGAMGAVFHQQAAELSSFSDPLAAMLYGALARSMEEWQLAATPVEPAEPFDQEKAMASVFVMAVLLYWLALETFSKKSFAQHVATLRAAGKNDVADAVERVALKPEKASFIVDRQRTPAAMHAYIKCLTIGMEQIFNARLSGLVADIASVAFQEKVNRDRVEAILEDLPKSTTNERPKGPPKP